ncbi:MAG TPA: Os1348 family NHLP clan protein, partial [Ktedonobacteraceae bacterium]
QVLGLATVDKQFVQELLKEPLVALQRRGFQLTPQEQKAFSEISASNLREFSQRLLQLLDREQSDQKRDDPEGRKGE